MDIFTVKPGVEQVASEECKAAGIKTNIFGKGILMADGLLKDKPYDFCFSSWLLFDAQVLAYNSYTEGIQSIADWYCNSIRSEIIVKSWPLVYLVFSENGYTIDLTKCKTVIDKIKKKVSRIAKLALPGYPEKQGYVDGLIILETEKKQLLFSRAARYYGQRRMKFDPSAPSRSFLKIEEAFSVMNKAPLPDQTVVDLGAAPGGWSYAASKRGAHVLAIDNGPLKKGASSSNLIEHKREDAFLYNPDKPVDWLFCDMVEDPFRVVKLVKTWLKRKLCKYAIINCKYGHADPFRILTVINSNDGFMNLAQNVICRHLYHDRDEFTVMISLI